MSGLTVDAENGDNAVHTPSNSPPASPSHARTTPLEGNELLMAVLNQVEYYFSRENLAKDTFLVNHMNTDLYVTIDLIASFSKLRNLANDPNVLLEAIAMSTKLETDETQTMVRPLEVGTKKSTIILREVGSDVPEEEVKTLFPEEDFGPIESIRSDVGDTWFVEFPKEISAKLVESVRQKTFRDKPIKVRMKAENPVRGLYAGDPGSPGSPNGLAATAAQFGGPGYAAGAYNYQQYGYYPPQMYFAPPPGGGGPRPAGGQQPQQWMYWDGTQQVAMQPQIQPQQQAGAYPAGRGAGGGKGRGRGSASGGLPANKILGSGGRGAGRGARVVAAANVAGALAPVALAAGAVPAGIKSKAKKAVKKADDMVKPDIQLNLAMDFPSLPGTPTGGAVDPFVDATQSDGGNDGPPAAEGGWKAMATKERPKVPPQKAPVPVPPQAVVETVAAVVETVAAPAPEAEVAEPTAPVPTSGPAEAAPAAALSSGWGAPKSWANIAKKPAPKAKKVEESASPKSPKRPGLGTTTEDVPDVWDQGDESPRKDNTAVTGGGAAAAAKPAEPTSPTRMSYAAMAKQTQAKAAAVKAPPAATMQSLGPQ